MNYIKKVTGYLLLAVTLLVSTIGYTQITNFGNNIGNNSATLNNPKISVSLSSSFSAFSQGYTAFSTTVMPKVSFSVSEKFSLNAGIGYSTSFINGTSEGVFNSYQGNYGHVFISGQYRVNEKISLRGTGYKTFNLNSTAPIKENNNPSFYDFSSQGVIMDVEYKVTDNFIINVGFEYREQKSPMYNPNGFQQFSPALNSMPSFIY